MNIELSCRWGRPGITRRAKGIFMRQSWIYRCKVISQFFQDSAWSLADRTRFPNGLASKQLPLSAKRRRPRAWDTRLRDHMTQGVHSRSDRKADRSNIVADYGLTLKGEDPKASPANFMTSRPPTGMAVAHQASRFCDDSPCPREATYLLRCKVSGDMRRVVSLTSNSRRGMLFKHHAFECH